MAVNCKQQILTVLLGYKRFRGRITPLYNINLLMNLIIDVIFEADRRFQMNIEQSCSLLWSITQELRFISSPNQVTLSQGHSVVSRI